MLWRGLGSILCRKKTTRNPTQPNSPQTPYSSRQTITPDSYTRQLRSTVKPDSYTRQLHATVTRDSYSRHFQWLRWGGGSLLGPPFVQPAQSSSAERLAPYECIQYTVPYFFASLHIHTVIMVFWFCVMHRHGIVLTLCANKTSMLFSSDIFTVNGVQRHSREWSKRGSEKP